MGYQVNPSSLAQASEIMLADKHDIPALLINLQWHSEVLHQSSQCSQASRGVSIPICWQWLRRRQPVLHLVQKTVAP